MGKIHKAISGSGLRQVGVYLRGAGVECCWGLEWVRLGVKTKMKSLLR
jgi:hypothetical protein